MEQHMWYQQTLTLSAKPRGFHLVTDEVIGQIRDLSRVKTGLPASAASAHVCFSHAQ
jgi:thiamine phosphate synthase YjbQ (UPF0047 family)